MLTKLYILIFSICLWHTTAAQLNWQWATNPSGSSSESGNSITSDQAGNVYVAGYFFSPTLVFGTYTLSNTGNYDAYVAKYDPAGNILWAKSLGGSFDDVANGITVDQSGNVYVTGYFYSPSLTTGSFTVANAGVGDAFVSKYDASGNEIWLKTIGGSFDEGGNGIAADNSGNIYITGFFQSSSIALGTNTLSNSGGDDLFLVKMDASGNSLWVKNGQCVSNDIGRNVCCDAFGNVIVTGQFTGSAVFGTSTLTSNGSTDGLSVKYNGSGIAIWANSAGGNLNDSGYGITADATGNIYVIGCYLSSNLSIGTTTFSGAGNTDLFLIKYSSAGSLLWAKTAGGSLDDTGFGIAADGSGNVYITGHVHSTSVTFGAYTLSTSGVGDMFLAQYDVSGNVAWAQNVGAGSDEGGSSVAVGPGGSVFTTGFFISASVSFTSNTLTNSGGDDVFVAKLLNPSIGLNPDLLNSRLTIYPVPSNGQFSISGDNIENSKLRIYSSEGKMIKEMSITERKINIDISDQPKGLYVLNLINGNAMLSRRIIIR